MMLLIAAGGAALGDDFTIDWYTIDGGGHMWSADGDFELSGTIGQPDANAVVMTGGDLELTGGFWVSGIVTPPCCPGDSNCDNQINWRDIDFFVAAMNDNVAAWEAMFLPGEPTCPFENNDTNEDGTVNWRDIDPFVAVMNTTCP
ncbi:MAG: hypothetical protein KAY37_17910 [Phycisphaerae bacterium]|nr:hypothetical protein [Phycisphaerae bacterium]